jgi:amino acid adenylation domain-containing protein
MVDAWVQRAPAQVAVCQGDHQWTYGELGARADTLARALLATGLGAGDVVAIAGARSFGLVAGMLAVLRAGGVLLPIDPQLPPARRCLMLREAGARMIIQVGVEADADAGTEQRAAVVGLRLTVDPRTAAPANSSWTPAGQMLTLPAIAPADPAYIFFTSGSSGVPKAVLGTHAGLSHFLCWQRETFAVGPSDRCPQLIGLSFDAVLRDVFLPLTSGATLCLPPREEDITPERVVTWLARECVTLLHTVPSLAQSWLAATDAPAPLPSLRWAFFAGEPLSDKLIRRWRATFPRTGAIVNFYGPTETTMIKSAHVVPAEPDPGMQPAGRPLPHTQTLVLTPQGQLCGIGEHGEIVLRTPFRTRGYLNAPWEAWRFRRNPWREDASDLLYYTGDRGRYRADGTFDVAGRLDQQVKIRGVRVEPEEVAAVLARHPAVQQAAVVARADAAGAPRLVAYLVSQPGSAPSSGDLRRFMQTHVPAYLVPDSFIALDRLPLTSNGKLDRGALPAPEPGRADAAYVAPRTPLEEALAGIWSDVLRVERVGIHDDFFALGGHSLLAIQLLARLRSALTVDIPLRALFELPTLAAQARHVELARWATAQAQVVTGAADREREEVIL